jgi:S-adenosylmethionine decarboxylase
MQARIWHKNYWITETDPKILKADFDIRLKAAGFGICDFMEKHFEPYGYTAIWLLSESHLAVHTFPEEGKSYVELSSCIEDPFRAFTSGK